MKKGLVRVFIHLFISAMLTFPYVSARGQDVIPENLKSVEWDFRRDVEKEGWTFVERATWQQRLSTRGHLFSSTVESDGFRKVSAGTTIALVQFSTNETGYGGLLIGSGAVGVVYDTFSFGWRIQGSTKTVSNGVYIRQYTLDADSNGQYSWWASLEEQKGQSMIINIYERRKH